MAFFIGIDGGGTSTRCVVGDERRVLGKATGASSKLTRVGPEAGRQAMQSVIRTACAAAKVDPRRVAQTCIGIAGASRPDIVEAVRVWAAEVLPGKIEITGDMVVAHEAAFGGGAGVLVVAGTGSICYGRDAEGKTARAGGGGPIVSDEGSGDWIGRLAVEHALSFEHSTRLTGMLMKVWNLRSPSEIVERAAQDPALDFAALFPTVQSAAAKGDKVAGAILSSAGEELAKLAITVVQELWPRRQRVRVATHGGVFENSPVVRRTFVTHLRKELRSSGYQIAVSSVAEPMMGALSLARKKARISAKGSAI
jgi:glucosamine kinase